MEWNTYICRGVPPARRALIGGNWKCYGTTKKVEQLINTLNDGGRFPLESEVVIAVPTLYLQTAKSTFRNDINVASQDVSLNGTGAFTGETDATMLTDSGIGWTLTGHSERRVGFGFPVSIYIY